jgi:ABC-2 type transport system permease protein
LSAAREGAAAPAPNLSPQGGSLRRIWGLMYRHLALYRRSWPRVLELMYWPVLQMVVWGFVTSYLVGAQHNAASSGLSAPSGATIAAGVLLGGVLLWEVTLRAQMGFAISFLEEVWSRNLGHVFVSPLRPWELVAGLAAMSVLRTAIGVGAAMILAFALYGFGLWSIGPVLVAYMAALMAMGWAVALAVTALILRHGAGAEALAWGVMFGLAPFAAVFYPVAVLPGWLQPIALSIPAAHVFEGMRAALVDGRIAWDHLAWAVALDAVWLAGAAWVFLAQFHQARVRGALLNIGE